MQLWKQNFKLRHVKFLFNLDWGNVYRRRIDLSLAVLNKRFSLTMQPTKNSNAHEKKLTNKAKATSTYSDRVFEKSRTGVFTRNHAKTMHGKFQVDLYISSKAVFSVVIGKAF